MEEKHISVISEECQELIRAMSDTLEMVSGKWKLVIIGTLIRNGSLQFLELKRALVKVASKKLTTDLQELEMNGLIVRKVKDTKPISVEYSLTEQGKSLEAIINNLVEWGQQYRKTL